MKLLWFATAATLFVSNVALANTRICVTVQQKSWYKPGPGPRPRRPRRPRRRPAPPVPPGPTVTIIEPEPSMPFLGPAPHAAPTAGERRATAIVKAPPPGEPPPRRMRPPANPHEIDPTLHLRRMLEYEVTHEPGFAAVDDAASSA